MLRLFKNKVFLLITVTLLLLVIMTIASNRYSQLNWLRNIINVPLTPVQKLISDIGEKVEDGMGYFKGIDAFRQENETLKSRVEALEKENSELASYRDQMDELRHAFDLKDRFEAYHIKGANVIAKDPGNWFNTFRVDIGMQEGIQNDDPIVTAGMGLIGRVLSSDLTSLTVISIINKDSAVSGWISKPGGGAVIIRGDVSLKEKGLCIMDRIPTDVDVAVNDVVETSGLGGIYPKGIIIGKVIDVRHSNSELDRYAIVQPVVDFKRLEKVFVLKEK